ncbi:hypothetical protein [Gordonia soli]|uniref:Uncharacterized protein n=1 Tax=Gordonia soli NBRC 108243 TaxID=1223545 RepID=M0QNA8_9ACTN|nr:hypothetical protein [Gordonia soli]GAC70063.1 hypothetical protein GS4_32_00070 [Gordonia soli NBRC 108243]
MRTVDDFQRTVDGSERTVDDLERTVDGSERTIDNETTTDHRTREDRTNAIEPETSPVDRALGLHVRGNLHRGAAEFGFMARDCGAVWLMHSVIR